MLIISHWYTSHSSVQLMKKTEELFNFENQPGYVEDLGNGHSVMVMIPELVDLDEELMERPIQERFEDLAQALRDEGHEELEVRRIARAVGGSGFNLASEIPDAGSYKTINIGKQPVVVVRDRKKKVHVLLNRCRHRAATVCEHKKRQNQ